MAAAQSLERLANPWRGRVGRASRHTLWAFALAALLGGAHLARQGTGVWRGLVLGLLTAVAAALVVGHLRERRDWRSPRRTIGRVLVPTDRAFGERALRALTLAERADRADFSGSRDLARFHYERLLARASLAAVERTARRRAARWTWAGMALMFGCALAAAFGPMRILEGLDVLAATKGRAPVPMDWLQFARVSAQPPGYLRLPARQLGRGGLPSSQPVGALLSVEGVPVREGRDLVLTDGRTEVPFVSDGAGGVVARWTLTESGVLGVAARFGDVLIPEGKPLVLNARPDLAPVVSVEGAPRTVQLRDIERLKILYFASDDHGLRQIDLVLSAGEHEERRVLARLSGETTEERGGHALTSGDEFLRRMFLPVQIRVEARDNDPLTGPKWGKSEAITVVPPPVGEPEADRFQALVGVHRLMVDFLAWQLASVDAPDRVREEHTRARRVANEMGVVLQDTFGGLSVPTGLATFLRGQLGVLHTRPAAGASPIRRTEDALLATDVAIRGLGRRDARTVAKRLGDVAEEAADGARLARETEHRRRGLTRLDAAIDAVEAGAKQLQRLGELGLDLGSVARSELRRVQRARALDDLTHAELAARHLAARLRRPEPSAAVVRGGGTESGVGRGPATWGDPSRADDLFDQLASELEQLAQEHAAEISGVEGALSDAEASVDSSQLRDEAARRAATIRRTVADLPLPGAEPGSARAAAALGREHAGSMAQSLERLSLADAVQSGRDAVSALGDARRLSKRRASPTDWVDDTLLRDAKRRLDKELVWAEYWLRRLQRRAEERAKGALDLASNREQGLAQRATNLAGRGRIRETALPHEMVDQLDRAASLMRDAASALHEGNGQRGVRLQRKAQRLLEHSSTGKTAAESGSDAAERGRDQNRESSRRGMRTDGRVPDGDANQHAAEFRRRVLEGLGREKGGRLAPAIKRYAEGLLR